MNLWSSLSRILISAVIGICWGRDAHGFVVGLGVLIALQVLNWPDSALKR